MIRIEIDEPTLARTRIAISPLAELVCGLCLLDGKLFYSTFFGYSASERKRRGLP